MEREIILLVVRMVRDADLVQFIRWDEMGKERGGKGRDVIKVLA